jgi:carboxylate-amine ligase
MLPVVELRDPLGVPWDLDTYVFRRFPAGKTSSEQRRFAAQGVFMTEQRATDQRFTALRGDDQFGLMLPAPWEGSRRMSVAETVAAFNHRDSFTIGAEEELMLVDAETLELAPAVDEVMRILGEDERFARELRPSQIEIVSRVCTTAVDACRELSSARRDLVTALNGRYRILASGTHPFSNGWGQITEGSRYTQIADEYTWAAQRSLACGLHVHVAVDGPARALAVYNALRSYLPELAALGANSAFFEGADTRMASIRPKLNEAFPRSGIPPAFQTWEELVRFVEWGRTGGLFPDSTHFWWEMRPHPVHGTIEIRAADTQTRVESAAAIVALIQALVAWIAERYDDGEELPVHETFWITENAWRAHRYGLRGWLVDLETGVPEPTRDRIARLIDVLEPYADRFGSVDQFSDARALLVGGGSDRQRYVFAREGILGLARWMVDETEDSAL